MLGLLGRITAVTIVFSLLPQIAESQKTSDDPSKSVVEKFAKYVDHVNKMMTQQSEEMKILKGRLAKQQNDMDKMKEFLEKIPHSGNYVAFYSMTTRKQTLANNDVIEFNDVRFNQGNHYSGSTSKFTCPDNGVYAFFTSISSHGGHRNTYIRWRIVRNGISLTRGHTGYGSTHNRLNPTWGSAVTGSQMLVSNCYKGQQIWVVAHVAADETNKQQTYHGYTSFAGFKLV